jgi:hypothetical protein
MSDSLYLSLWFPGFEAEEMLPRTVGVLRQFPFSQSELGVTYVSVQPVSWSEPTVLERRFRPALPPEEAAGEISEFAHDDYAIVFEAYWDLWLPDGTGTEWVLRPSRVEFVAQGKEFDNAAFTDSGHLEINLGLDFPFLFEEVDLTPAVEQRVKANVAKLVDFTNNLEKNCNLTGRVLWSESEDNLAQKLITRLQRAH